jgi:hypothetical protein
MSSILSCRLACDGEPLYVEYVTQTLPDVKAVAFMIDVSQLFLLGERGR